MIAHICRLSLRHKSSIQANSYRLPYARRSYGSLIYLRQKLRRCPQLPLPRKKRLLQLCPDITGEFPNNDVEYDKYYAGAFWTGTPFEGGYSDDPQSKGKTGRFKASWANSIYGRTSSDVAVSAVYTLIIIKA